MNAKFSLVIIISWMAFASCNDVSSDSVDCNTYDYSDCITSEPYEGSMFVKLTINEENTKVPLAFYEGKLEENNLLFMDTAYDEYYDTILAIGNYYTIAAEYLQDGKKIIAVDGDVIKKSHSNICDSVCWTIKTGSVNVRLK